MKKLLLTFISGVTLLGAVKAQFISSYSFTQNSGTYTAISGGTALGDTATDDQRFVDPGVLGGSSSTISGVGFPIGFNFTYNGIVFDRLGVNANGWISLGQSSLTPAVDMNSSSSYSAISATSTATPTLLRNRIAAFSRDLKAQPGATLRIETTGTAPNRVCVVQWAGYRKYSYPASVGDNFNFQIRLNETANTVEVVYGTMTNNATATKAQVGLSGTTNSDFNNRKSTTSWSASAAGTVNTDTMSFSSSVFPASGQTYKWTPPPACSGTPTAGTITGVDSTCNGVSFVLSLTGYSTASGLTFQWQSSSSMSGTYTNISGATGTTYTATQTAATYYQCVVTCSNGGASATTTVHGVTAKAPTNCYCAPSTSCSLGDVITNVTFGGVNNTSTCSTGGDTLYSNMLDTFYRNSTYPISVTVGDGGTEYVSMWIDYNQNGMFDSTEFTMIGSGNDTSIVSSFMVSGTSLLGKTRMRLRVRYNTALTASGACSTYTYGETEDYLIFIADSSSSAGIKESEILNNLVLYPNPTTGIFNILAASANFNELSINVIDIQGKLVYSSSEKNVSSSYNKQINLEHLAKGLYYVKFTTEKGAKVQKLVIQ